MMIRWPVVTETCPALGGGFSFPGGGSYDSQKGLEFTVEQYSQIDARKRGVNVQQSKSNAQISFKNLFWADLPPKTKSLEPTNVMPW
jgi:hypothetical protein